MSITIRVRTIKLSYWVGEQVSLGICVSWVRERISLEGYVFPVQGNIIYVTSDRCFPHIGNRYHQGYVFPGQGRGTHITRDMCFLGRGKHITSDMKKGKTYHYRYVFPIQEFPTQETYIPNDMFPIRGKHISLVIHVPLPRKHTSLVICVPFTWETRITRDMCFSLFGNTYPQ